MERHWRDVEAAREDWWAVHKIAHRLKREYEELRDAYDAEYEAKRAAYLAKLDERTDPFADPTT